jgi:hypothetical protein
MNAEKAFSPQDTTELLRRILNAVEPAKPKRGLPEFYEQEIKTKRH